MRLQAHRRRRAITVAVGALAIATGATRPLAAQGGRQLSQPAELAPIEATQPAHLEPARGILRGLVGTWRFEIWFAGNFDGAPDASGTRVVAALFDDLRLTWTEQLDHSTIQGQGIIGFDPGGDRFFSTAVYNAGAAPELLTGTLDFAGPLITFSPIPSGASSGQRLVQSSALSVLDQNHFMWAALDRGWRAVFTRQP